MKQLELFAPIRGPMIKRPVDAHGGIERGEIDETLRLPQPGLALDAARIELHQHRKSCLWMWSASHAASGSGGSYRVGEKWGKFASTRDDALHHAIAEIGDRLKEDCKDARRIRAWLDGLT